MYQQIVGPRRTNEYYVDFPSLALDPIDESLRSQCFRRKNVEVRVLEVNRQKQTEHIFKGEWPLDRLVPDLRLGPPYRYPCRLILDFGYVNQLEEVGSNVVPEIDDPFAVPELRFACGLMRMLESQSAVRGNSIFRVPAITEYTFSVSPNSEDGTLADLPAPVALFGRCVQFIGRMFHDVTAANPHIVNPDGISMNTEYKPRYFEFNGLVAVSPNLTSLVVSYFQSVHTDVPVPGDTLTYPAAKFTIQCSDVVFNDYRLPLEPIVYFNKTYLSKHGMPTFGVMATCDRENNFLPSPFFDIPGVLNDPSVDDHRRVIRQASWSPLYSKRSPGPLHTMCVIEVNEHMERHDRTGFAGPPRALYQMPSMMEYLTDPTSEGTPLLSGLFRLCHWLDGKAEHDLNDDETTQYYRCPRVDRERSEMLAADAREYEATGHDSAANSYGNFLDHINDLSMRRGWDHGTGNSTELDRTHCKALCSVEVFFAGTLIWVCRNKHFISTATDRCDLTGAKFRTKILSRLLSGQDANNAISGICRIRVTFERLLRTWGKPGQEDQLSAMPGPMAIAPPTPPGESGGDEMDVGSSVTDVCC